MVSQKVLGDGTGAGAGDGSEATCIMDSCRAAATAATDMLGEHTVPTVSLMSMMWDSIYKFLEPLRWKSLALVITAGVGQVPLAKNDSLISNGTVNSDVYFYGGSPPVYPSPLGNGTGDWADAYASAKALVAQMTMDEKISLTGGSSENTGCDGNIAPIPRLGFPGLCLKDSGNGVRQTDFVNGYPAALHAGASWNRDLVHQRASHMGMEFRMKGINLLLGPTIGPMGRVVTGGRNWESFSVDPYLTGQLAYETVQGVQEVGVITSTKHFLANEQETNRQDSETARRGPGIEGVSANIDDRTLHELYLWAFQDALHAGSGSIMCSYNRLNNSYACQNSKLLNGILKDELGFQGYVVTDWEGQHSGVASTLAGLDMTMPSPKEYWGHNLGVSVRNGSVSKKRLDDMATRILAPWYKMGQNSDYPARGMNRRIEAKNPASKPVLFDGAVEGHVLVKNVDNILPLKSPRLLSLFGYDAKTPEVVNGALPNWELQGQIATSGTLIGGGGSAAITPARISSPYSALEQRAYDDNTGLLWDFSNAGATSNVDSESSACLVFINAWAQEGSDRPGIQDNYSDTLVNNIANQCANTIVIIHNAGIRLVDRFEANPNVKAIIFAHLPGQDSGRALVSLLYGDVNFSGKLPYTVAHSDADYGHLLSPSQPEGMFRFYPQSNFTEGVAIDYRHFDRYNITPRYEFGFGLSYTTFAYADLQISVPVRPEKLALYPVGPVLQGGQEDLWHEIVRVQARVTNSGPVAGKEVAQLYIGVPGGPARQLRGFEKVLIAPGESVTVSFALTRRDLSVWDVVAQKWKLQRGIYQVYVGSSSRKLPLVGALRL